MTRTSVYLFSDDCDKIKSLAEKYDRDEAWIIRQLIHRNVDNFTEVTGLSHAVREKLEREMNPSPEEQDARINNSQLTGLEVEKAIEHYFSTYDVEIKPPTEKK